MGALRRAGTCTIANGQTVSNALELMDSMVVGLITPAALTSIAITFQGSHDGVTYKAVTKTDGSAYSVTVAASKYMMIPPNDLAGLRYVKLVAGSAEAADRDIIVMVRDYA